MESAGELEGDAPPNGRRPGMKWAEKYLGQVIRTITPMHYFTIADILAMFIPAGFSLVDAYKFDIKKMKRLDPHGELGANFSVVLRKSLTPTA
jgi:hypothetical protein